MLLFHESNFPFITTPLTQTQEPVLPLPTHDDIETPPTHVESISPSPQVDNETSSNFIATPLSNQTVTNSHPPSPSPHVAPFIRHSDRPKRTPTYLDDYACSHVSSSSPLNASTPGSSKKCTHHPLCKYISYKNLSPSYQSFIANITLPVEPNTYAEAAKDPRW
ncbi:hypothetical protein PS2_024209 [Malus domestica]